MRVFTTALAVFLILSATCIGQIKSEAKTISEKVTGMEKFSGYFNIYWDAGTGKLWLEVDKWNSEFLYVHSLPAGIGSNDIGLDRGQLGGEHVVRFSRSGPRILLVEPNYSFRAITTDPDERRAVEEAFAQSVLWGFDIVAEEHGAALVDASAFFLRDAHDVIGTLKRSNQGAFRLDLSRSAIYLPRMKNFPKNTEVEAMLTFTGDEPGRWLQSVVPTPQAVTVRQHHSFVQLPDGDFKPRAFDPRSGYYPTGYFDYATPISEPMKKQFITRHRLKKKDSNASVSEPVQPIIYYLDRGTPEPIRSALMDGARWWDQAFAAAGYKNAFQVKLMPEEADPMDVRYNLIQWVHRSTRGWSYGGGVTDPRTGEIIKGHVTLGSLRVRQDFLIAEGLIAQYEEGTPVDPAMQAMALARLRQLAAHEVGHTLGLSHNYIASTAGRSSVMDYPSPLVRIKNDHELDLSDSYDSKIGEWDKVSIEYGYGDFPGGVDEKKELDKILRSAASRGLIFMTDEDARPQGSAHPKTHLWDNGANAVDELGKIMKIRSIALENFSEKKIRSGMPMSSLEEVLVPVYMGHRYQVEAAVKVVGGLDYTYALRGDGQIITQMVPPQEQRRAVDAVLATISPHALALPDRIIRLIPPRAYGYPRTRETFTSRTGVTFDPLSAAETAAQLSVGLLLNPERAARLVDYHARDEQCPGLGEVLDRLVLATWKMKLKGYHAEIGRVVDRVVLYNMMSLAANMNASGQVRAISLLKIQELKEWLSKQSKEAKDESRRAHAMFALAQIKLFEENPKQLDLPKPVNPPDGPPIGSGSCDFD